MDKQPERVMLKQLLRSLFFSYCISDYERDMHSMVNIHIKGLSCGIPGGVGYIPLSVWECGVYRDNIFMFPFRGKFNSNTDLRSPDTDWSLGFQ